MISDLGRWREVQEYEISKEINATNKLGYAGMMDGIGSCGFALASSPPHGAEDGHAMSSGSLV